MGNCQSMFLEDEIMLVIANDPFLNLGRNKAYIKRCNGTYLGMRALIAKFPDEGLRLQTGKWWRCLF